MEGKMLFLVAYGNIKVVTWAFDREAAKRAAWSWIGGDKESYRVTPLTHKLDRVHLDLTLQV